MKRYLAPIAVLLMFLSIAPAFAAGKRYTYYRVGNAGDVATSVSGGTVLMGGGTDVDAAFQWMCGQAGNGDFLVIRATGTDAYNPYIQGLCPGANSVATLIVASIAGANDPFVVSTVRNAEAIFIAGGDQSNYINYWKGTALQSALNDGIARGVVVGGTSAGMMVLTQFIYSAQASQGVTSSQALADPFNRYISLDRDFAVTQPPLPAIGDSHFVTRDRMGRDLAFMCRIAVNGWDTAPRAISVDEATALLITRTGTATLVGSSYAYFLQAPGPAAVCVAKTPLTYENIAVRRIGTTGTFNLTTWSGTNVTSYTVSAVNGVLTGQIY